LLFLNVTNIGNTPQLFVGLGNIQIKNEQGIAYDVEMDTSSKAADMYGVPNSLMVEPGDVAQVLVAFDLPLDSPFYLLMPGYLAEDNGQNIKLEIP
jgi:uncharacterized cupredoxin-like copper-binding protein